NALNAARAWHPFGAHLKGVASDNRSEFGVGTDSTNSTKLRMVRFDPNSLAITAETELTTSGTTLSPDAMVLSRQGAVYTLARFSRGSLTIRRKGVVEGQPVTAATDENYFLAKLDASNLRMLKQKAFPVRGGVKRLGPGALNLNRGNLVVAGTLEDGNFDPNPPLPFPSNKNSIPTTNHPASFFMLAHDADLQFAGQLHLTISAVYHTEDGARTPLPDGVPGLGVIRVAQGERYKIELPEHYYMNNRSEVIRIGGRSRDDLHDDLAGQAAVSRFTPYSYAVNQDKTKTTQTRTITGLGRSLEVAMIADTAVTFFLKTEHALTIDSRVEEDLGLSRKNSLAFGRPDPPVMKHWIPENQLVIATIDGIVPSVKHP
ncbi:MAG: hypothetical protein AAF492_30195, partial [Verrucomicrobiota bacterium]